MGSQERGWVDVVRNRVFGGLKKHRHKELNTLELSKSASHPRLPSASHFTTGEPTSSGTG
jgi:hypothetical protein